MESDCNAHPSFGAVDLAQVPDRLLATQVIATLGLAVAHSNLSHGAATVMVVNNGKRNNSSAGAHCRRGHVFEAEPRKELATYGSMPSWH